MKGRSTFLVHVNRLKHVHIRLNEKITYEHGIEKSSSTSEHTTFTNTEETPSTSEVHISSTIIYPTVTNTNLTNITQPTISRRIRGLPKRYGDFSMK